jgi:putative ABC transport system permease protein
MFAFDYKKGETITLGLVNQEEGDSIIKGDLHTYEISEVTNKRPFGFSFISYEPLIIMSDETFRDYFGDKTIVEKYYFESEKPDNLQDDLEKAFSDIDVEVTNLDKEHRMMKSFHLLIAIFLYGFVAVIALIGITSIFNTITTNMELRKREFATLKSVGMTTKEFNRMISLESFFYGTKSLLIGIPIGILLSYWLSNLLNEGEEIVKYQIPFTSILVSIIIVFFLITIIMKYSINKINKQNTIETIRNENI